MNAHQIRASQRVSFTAALLLTAWVLPLLTGAAAFGQERANEAKYKLAEKFSSSSLRRFIHSSSVTPGWIGDTGRFWYRYSTSTGMHYYLVDPEARTKTALFDQDALAAKLSEASEKAVVGAQLNLGNLKVDDTGETLSFTFEGRKYGYTLASHELEDQGKAPPPRRSRRGGFGRRGRGEQERRERGRREQEQRGGGENQSSGGRPAREHRSFAPDRSAYVYGEGFNLYFVQGTEVSEETTEYKSNGGPVAATYEKGEKTGDDQDAQTPATAKPKKPKFEYDEKKAVQLTTDGVDAYGYGGAREKKGRVRVSWSTDSSMFYITRRDSREVAELYLVDSLAEPRPKLISYKYPLPGEENITSSELYMFDRKSKALQRVETKWKDEGYRNVHWLKDTPELRFVRRDRPMRTVEFCSADPATGKVTVLFGEKFADAYLATQNIRYLHESGEMIWWSERTGWGQFYLYGIDGALKNAITSGPFRASRIVHVDPENRFLYFRGNGREEGENVYFNHLYRIRLDGSGLTLLDPGDANHRSTLSKSRRFVVDNYSRVDLAPVSVLRDAEGNKIMRLEEADLDGLHGIGWSMPETFVVKAADGVTDLYGNMWKPFDFDPSKKYPIIASVYPGPQSEGVTHRFTASNGQQQLAQLGFVVIQVGNRGGTPARSKAYHKHSYFNLRDYGLADKKAAIEELAARHPFIDVERVGIYGHSGGGFMSAAALLQKPYNKFFKVGVATSGNHDNNVYGIHWAERYHGLKEVPVKKSESEGKGETKTQDGKKDSQDGKKQDTEQDAKGEEKTKFEIRVPTNAELAENLRGHLLLIHGEIDNNVHPAGTMRLVNALIKANKRFDMLIIPGARHGYGSSRQYVTHRTWEYFAEHLLGDRQRGADIFEKARRTGDN